MVSHCQPKINCSECLPFCVNPLNAKGTLVENRRKDYIHHIYPNCGSNSINIIVDNTPNESPKWSDRGGQERKPNILKWGSSCLENK